MKRVLLGVGVVVMVLVLVGGAVFYSAFANNKPLVDGQVLAPGVTLVKDGFVSLDLLDAGPGKVALIDCGNDKEGKGVLAALSARGLGPAAVAAIFLTHGHPDHLGACKLFPAAEVYAMEADVALAGAAAKVTHPLHDGEVVEVGTLKVEAFATPGHTAGSAVYFASGVLFFGDSAAGSKDETMLPPVGFFSKDAAQDIASVKALATRLQPRAGEVKTLAFSHSGPLDGFAQLAAFASSH